MQPVFATRSSLMPPDARPLLPSQAPAAQRPASTEQDSEFERVGGEKLDSPPWLLSGGQVDYEEMTQHLLKAKRSLQVRVISQNFKYVDDVWYQITFVHAENDHALLSVVCEMNSLAIRV
jgi:hypothetical protein